MHRDIASWALYMRWDMFSIITITLSFALAETLILFLAKGLLKAKSYQFGKRVRSDLKAPTIIMMIGTPINSADIQAARVSPS